MVTSVDALCSPLRPEAAVPSKRAAVTGREMVDDQTDGDGAEI